MCNVLDHRKIKTFHQGKDGNNLLLLWLVLLIEAGKSDRGGYLMISDNLPYTMENLSMISKIPLSVVKKGLALFVDLDMVDTHDRAIFIKNWSKYQSEDKLKARRENDRLRQKRYRDKERIKMQSPPHSSQMSRDNHGGALRDVTIQNRTDKKQDKTTTEQTMLLLQGTPFAIVSAQEISDLEERHGAGKLLKAADIAAETWRKDGKDRHNPVGYLQSLCTSLIVPGWYVSFDAREAKANDVRQREMTTKAEHLRIKTEEEAKNTAQTLLWNSFSDEQREEYCKRSTPKFSTNIQLPFEVATILAKKMAWDERPLDMAEKMPLQL